MPTANKPDGLRYKCDEWQHLGLACPEADSSHSQWETELSKVFLPREPAFTFTNTGACCNKH
jgi:hypothetical protein